MSAWVNVAEVWRGNFLECIHRGRAVVCDARANVVHEWGDVNGVVLPRSSCKMLQALPLLESGAAAHYALETRHLALACASHQGAHIHTDIVGAWLAGLGLSERDLRCGPQVPRGKEEQDELILAGHVPTRIHNNCSGKHTGFLTCAQHLGGGLDYVDSDHPVQKSVLAAFEEMTGETSPGFAIDGCSAPNYACSLRGLATAMARMASPARLGATRGAAAGQLVSAMKTHPDLVAGTQRACTELMEAMDGGAVVKTGAEGVFVAILPKSGLGAAVKIEDGATRAAECAMATLLVRLGAASADHPNVTRRLCPTQYNFAGLEVGRIAPAEEFFADGAPI